jgi:hypothetical protein
MGWIGHTLRKPPENTTRQLFNWNRQGTRKVGRPKQAWRRSVETEVETDGWTWAQIEKMPQNRVRVWLQPLLHRELQGISK